MHRLLLALALAASLAAEPSAFLDFLSSLWSDSGSQLDPDGGPVPRTDTGCHLDPDGRCITERSDEGCRIDPNGGCLTPQSDEGCRIDPDGRCAS
jgi:hypothetical protein